MSRNVFACETGGVSLVSRTVDSRVVPSQPSPSVYRAAERAYGHAAVQCCTVVVLASSDARPTVSVFAGPAPQPELRERRCQLVRVVSHRLVWAGWRRGRSGLVR
uniref:Uncharacterized protein n=1 Tax=Plectus sambesii TaxID=2011161 RepID=A0A914UVM1_9BILA